MLTSPGGQVGRHWCLPRQADRRRALVLTSPGGEAEGAGAYLARRRGGGHWCLPRPAERRRALVLTSPGGQVGRRWCLPRQADRRRALVLFSPGGQAEGTGAYLARRTGGETLVLTSPGGQVGSWCLPRQADRRRALVLTSPGVQAEGAGAYLARRTGGGRWCLPRQADKWGDTGAYLARRTGGGRWCLPRQADRRRALVLTSPGGQAEGAGAYLARRTGGGHWCLPRPADRRGDTGAYLARRTGGETMVLGAPRLQVDDRVEAEAVCDVCSERLAATGVAVLTALQTGAGGLPAGRDERVRRHDRVTPPERLLPAAERAPRPPGQTPAACSVRPTVKLRWPTIIIWKSQQKYTYWGHKHCSVASADQLLSPRVRYISFYSNADVTRLICPLRNQAAVSALPRQCQR